jgi:hypothetical protein
VFMVCVKRAQFPLALTQCFLVFTYSDLPCLDCNGYSCGDGGLGVLRLVAGMKLRFSIRDLLWLAELDLAH